jgi:hypothetical protein
MTWRVELTDSARTSHHRAPPTMTQAHPNWIANFICGIADDVLRDR